MIQKEMSSPIHRKINFKIKKHTPLKSATENLNEKQMLFKLEEYISENQRQADTIIEKNKEIVLSKIMLKEYMNSN